MSETNKERITYHNQLIDQAQEKVDALPEAGSGEGGAAPVVEPLTVTANGTYEAPDGVDGYNPVTVNVDVYALPSLLSPGSAADLMKGKQLIGENGEIIDGTYEPEDLSAVLNEQDAIIAELQTALEGKAAGGGASVETCTVAITAPFYMNTYLVSYSTDENGEMTLRCEVPVSESAVTSGEIQVAQNTIIRLVRESTIQAAYVANVVGEGVNVLSDDLKGNLVIAIGKGDVSITLTASGGSGAD